MFRFAPLLLVGCLTSAPLPVTPEGPPKPVPPPEAPIVAVPEPQGQCRVIEQQPAGRDATIQLVACHVGDDYTDQLVLRRRNTPVVVGPIRAWTADEDDGRKMSLVGALAVPDGTPPVVMTILHPSEEEPNGYGRLEIHQQLDARWKVLEYHPGYGISAVFSGDRRALQVQLCHEDESSCEHYALRWDGRLSR